MHFSSTSELKAYNAGWLFHCKISLPQVCHVLIVVDLCVMFFVVYSMYVVLFYRHLCNGPFVSSTYKRCSMLVYIQLDVQVHSDMLFN